jgi:ATP-dependent Clp protease adapter protein ClpS
VLLHNDDVNDRVFVVNTIVSLTPLDESDAVNRMLEAERQGVSLLLTTHQERAELYVQQFGGCNLTVTAEPA